MKTFQKSAESLLKDYSISKQQKLLRLVTQACTHVKIGQTSIALENTHIHPHGINRSLKHHQHHFLEIHIPYSGEGFVETEGKKHPFRFGEFTTNPPEQVHYWEMTKAPLPMLILWIRLEQRTENPEPQDQLLINFFETREIVHPLPDDFFFLCKGLFAEAAAPRIGIETALSNYLSQMILTLARATAAPSRIEQKIAVEPKDRDERIVFMVDQFLKNNLSGEFQLEDIARQVSLSTRSLTRKYREIKKTSVGEELTRLRMVRAEELLRETDKPIKAIAWECGFPDQRYFTRKFKKSYRESPGDYRKKLVSPE